MRSLAPRLVAPTLLLLLAGVTVVVLPSVARGEEGCERATPPCLVALRLPSNAARSPSLPPGFSRGLHHEVSTPEAGAATRSESATTAEATTDQIPPDAPLDDAPRSAPLAKPLARPSWKVPILHSAGVMVGMRLSLAVIWPDNYARVEKPLQHLEIAYTRPPEYLSGRPLLESDGSPMWLNTAGLGLFGSEIYSRTRSCGRGALESFAAAAAASTFWEYGIEAWHQRPSAFDLVWTPVMGSVLGEGRYQALQWLRDHQTMSGALRKSLMFIVDPLGEAERGILDSSC